MKARDIIGRTVVGVRQHRVTTHVTGGYGVEGDGSKEVESAWAVEALELDNGKVLVLMAIETDTEPVVTAWVVTPNHSKDES
jgi:hypothetical protein